LQLRLKLTFDGLVFRIERKVVLRVRCLELAQLGLACLGLGKRGGAPAWLARG
jgi:hypothetical protein